MQSPRDILADLWTLAGGEPSALDAVTLTGAEPMLPSSFRVAAAAQASIAASGLAAAEIWKLRSGETQDVTVDMLHAIVECRSERYLRRRRQAAAADLGSDRRHLHARATSAIVRLHTNFKHHRAAVCNVLQCEPEREKIQAALNAMGRRGVRDRGLCRRRRGLADALP